MNSPPPYRRLLQQFGIGLKTNSRRDGGVLVRVSAQKLTVKSEELTARENLGRTLKVLPGAGNRRLIEA